MMTFQRIVDSDLFHHRNHRLCGRAPQQVLPREPFSIEAYPEDIKWYVWFGYMEAFVEYSRLRSGLKAGEIKNAAFDPYYSNYYPSIPSQRTIDIAKYLFKRIFPNVFGIQ